MKGSAMPANAPSIAHMLPWGGIGGVEIATLRMVEATSDRFRHIAFCIPEATQLQQAFRDQGTEVVVYRSPEPSLRHGQRFFRESRALADQIRGAHADIVHFSETKAAEHASLAAHLAHAKTVCHVRNTYSTLNLRQRLPLLGTDLFLFVSLEARRQFGLSVPDRRTRVIYDPIEMSAEDLAVDACAVRAELGVAAGRPVIGTVARVNPQKDYFTLAAAARRVLDRHPDALFLIVGDNAQIALNRQHYAEVMERLRQLNIADSFLFTGHRNDVPRMIAAMDISVLSTHREGFGLCIAESMAMGKPVVATAVGGLLEVVTDNRTGYLCPHGDSDQLARKIICLLDHPAQAAAFGSAGRQYVIQKFSRRQFIDQISEVYLGLISKPLFQEHRSIQEHR